MAGSAFLTQGDRGQVPAMGRWRVLQELQVLEVFPERPVLRGLPFPPLWPGEVPEPAGRVVSSLVVVGAR